MSDRSDRLVRGEKFFITEVMLRLRSGQAPEHRGLGGPRGVSLVDYYLGSWESPMGQSVGTKKKVAVLGAGKIGSILLQSFLRDGLLTPAQTWARWHIRSGLGY